MRKHKNTPSGIISDEIWDPTRTDPRIQAMIVNGLSGSGVYNENHELIGIVSCAHKNIATKAIEDLFAQAIKSKDKESAKLLLSSLPERIKHPLLNIHQMITLSDIQELLGTSI